ncbi:MAG: hypothetical protein GX851_00795 [Clostridiales bacterium]|jgi:hypothetical protein|nr:hypothetical protein [Clostridiales bacterium]
MKNRIFKLAAVVMIIAMMASFAACGGNNEEPTTTTTLGDTTTTTEDSAQAGVTTLEDNGDETSATPDADGTTKKDETPSPGNDTPVDPQQPSVAPVQNAAPVNGSKAEILEYYNKVANAAKKYSGTVKIDRAQGTTSSLDEISVEGLRSKAEDMLPNDYPTKKSATYTAGKTSDGDTLSRMLPPDKADHTSKLTAAGVKTATCTAQGSGYKVVITLVEEKGNDINFKPPHHGACMDTLSITSEDIKPFTLKSAEITYVGATITATVDAEGRLTELNINEPVVIQGKLSFIGIPLITAKITGTWKQELKLSY